MAMALSDARAVVRRARNHGRRQVALGGHSLGASLAVAYAAWDFHGRPGFKDLEGVVLIDGGLLGSFDGYDLAQAQKAIAELQTADPFLDLLGVGLPEAAGHLRRGRRPLRGEGPDRLGDDPAGVIRSCPPQFNPAFPVTNRALLGYAFDRDTSPAELGLLHVNGGGLAPWGDPRDWVDGGRDAGQPASPRPSARSRRTPSSGTSRSG